MVEDYQAEFEFFTPAATTKTEVEIREAEDEIRSNIKDVRYIVREYPAEIVAQKYLQGLEVDKNEIFIPDYQRDLVWPDKRQSKFIESMLIGIPVPFLFVADISADEDPESAGRLEIVDGVQRVRTLARFLTNELVLLDLERLKKLNGFRFSDLHASRQKRFRRATLRLIELTEEVTEDIRREMFDRLNSGQMGLQYIEIRRGMEQGPFSDFVTHLAGDEMLKSLAPVSEPLRKRFEYEELVTRFFAFANNYENYGTGGKVVSDFLLSYVREMNKRLSDDGAADLAEGMTAEWRGMLQFVEAAFPTGFKRPSGPGRKVPRVRFEAIAVGVALALREKPDLAPDQQAVSKWLVGNEFLRWTTSDASNNKSNLVGRIEFVRNSLLGR